MKTRKTIDRNWDEYDRLVAECHLDNYGIIYLDDYGCPMDIEDVENTLSEYEF